MGPIKKSLLFAGIAASTSILCYFTSSITESLILFLLSTITFFIGIFISITGSAKAFSLWKFKKSSKGAHMEVIDTMYKAGSLCIDFDRYHYKFIAGGPLNPSGLEDLPPYSSKTEKMVFPIEAENDLRAVFANDSSDSSCRTIRRVELPFIVCKWPKDYKTPKAVQTEIAKEEFESGLNAAYLITDGEQGKPPKYLN